MNHLRNQRKSRAKMDSKGKNCWNARRAFQHTVNRQWHGGEESCRTIIHNYYILEVADQVLRFQQYFPPLSAALFTYSRFEIDDQQAFANFHCLLALRFPILLSRVAVQCRLLLYYHIIITIIFIRAVLGLWSLDRKWIGISEIRSCHMFLVFRITFVSFLIIRATKLNVCNQKEYFRIR